MTARRPPLLGLEELASGFARPSARPRAVAPPVSKAPISSRLWNTWVGPCAPRISAEARGRLDVARLVADAENVLARDAAAPQHAPESGRLAEGRGPAFVMADQRGVFRAQDAPDVPLGVRRYDRKRHALGMYAPQEVARAREQADLVGVAPHPLAHGIRDQRHLPGGHAEMADDGAVVAPAQQGELVVLDALEPIPVRHLIDGPPHPGGAVGQRAVKIKDDEPIGHGGFRSS